MAFGYSGIKEIFGNREDCDSNRPWHEDKDTMALLVVDLVHLAVRFPFVSASQSLESRSSL